MYTFTEYDWDAKAHDILADLGTEIYFKDPLRTKIVTLRDVASHSTGIPDYDPVWKTQNTSKIDFPRSR